MSSFYAARFDSAGVLLLDDVESGRVDPFDTYDPKQGGDSIRAQIVAEIQQAGGDDPHDRWSFAPFFVARELKLDQAYFHEAKAGALPRIAFRVFDDSPQGWYIWPQAAGAVQPTMLERRPDWWVPVQFEGEP